jgi:hypothetical protein
VRSVPNLWRVCSFSPTCQRPDDRARYRGRGPLSLAPVVKAYVKEALERAGKFNPDLFVFASTASARVPGSSRSLL